MTQSIGKRPLVLLTGASGLFGHAFIEAFHGKYEIVGLYNSRKPVGVKSESKLFDVSSNAHREFAIKAIHCNLNNLESTREIFNTICDTCGPPNFLINAAADIRFLGNTLDYVAHVDEANQQLTLNSSVPAFLASLIFHRCWKHIRPPDQNASILNVSSISGMKFYKGTHQAVYAASKAALNMITLYMASEYMPYKIRVNGIAPGRFEAGESAARIVQEAEKIMTGSKTGQVISI